MSLWFLSAGIREYKIKGLNIGTKINYKLQHDVDLGELDTSLVTKTLYNSDLSVSSLSSLAEPKSEYRFDDFSDLSKFLLDNKKLGLLLSRDFRFIEKASGKTASKLIGEDLKIVWNCIGGRKKKKQVLNLKNMAVDALPTNKIIKDLVKVEAGRLIRQAGITKVTNKLGKAGVPKPYNNRARKLAGSNDSMTRSKKNSLAYVLTSTTTAFQGLVAEKITPMSSTMMPLQYPVAITCERRRTYKMRVKYIPSTTSYTAPAGDIFIIYHMNPLSAGATDAVDAGSCTYKAIGPANKVLELEIPCDGVYRYNSDYKTGGVETNSPGLLFDGLLNICCEVSNAQLLGKVYIETDIEFFDFRPAVAAAATSSGSIVEGFHAGCKYPTYLNSANNGVVHRLVSEMFGNLQSYTTSDGKLSGAGLDGNASHVGVNNGVYYFVFPSSVLKRVGKGNLIVLRFLLTPEVDTTSQLMGNATTYTGPSWSADKTWVNISANSDLVINGFPSAQMLSVTGTEASEGLNSIFGYWTLLVTQTDNEAHVKCRPPVPLSYEDRDTDFHLRWWLSTPSGQVLNEYPTTYFPVAALEHPIKLTKDKFLPSNEKDKKTSVGGDAGKYSIASSDDEWVN